MPLELHTQEDIVFIHPLERLMTVDAPAAKSQPHAMPSKQELKLSPDLSVLEYVDSSGLGGRKIACNMGFSTAAVKFVAECEGSHDHEARNEAVSTLLLV